MAFELPRLPYPKTALEPHMSEKTLDVHHDGHHRAYVTKLNSLIADSPLRSKSLETIIRETAADASKTSIFNNGAQVWNHTFFWKSMKPNGGGAPVGDLAQRIARDFGSLEKFKTAFKQSAIEQFGSGWAWLVTDKGELKVTKTSNAMTPIALGQTPIIACDVWEHAYYLDYQNRRGDFVQAFLDKLLNWDFALANAKLAAS